MSVALVIRGVLPWDHAVVAYALFDRYTRARSGESPDGWSIGVVVFASQFADLVDKPLAWHFGLLPSGRTLSHSIFLAVPLVLVVDAVARARGRPDLGVAFAIGHLSHLGTDVLPPGEGRSLRIGDILWPLTDR